MGLKLTLTRWRCPLHSRVGRTGLAVPPLEKQEQTAGVKIGDAKNGSTAQLSTLRGVSM
jgi:hypothetical protein